LDLAGSSYYTARAYRRAAELVRGLATPVVTLVREGRVRELRGIGPGIEARLRELVETGRIKELEELEREVRPELVGFGRLLGLSPKRSVEIGEFLGISTAAEFREAIEAGRLRSVPGVGPKTIRALALVSDIVYGSPASMKDPARFSFAHGGKDGHPYPVNRVVYDESIHYLRDAVDKARIGRTDKLQALERLSDWETQ